MDLKKTKKNPTTTKHFFGTMWNSADDKPGCYILHHGSVLQVPSRLPLIQCQLANPSKFLDVFKHLRTWFWKRRHPGARVRLLRMCAATQ